MGHSRTKKGKEVKQKIDWTFKIDLDIELDRSSKSKVAFLSGLERTYYPGDPGHSKFALVYGSGGFDADSPSFTFIPQPEIGAKRFYSKKGYGIAGLSAPRFPLLNNEGDAPSPDKYQRELLKPLLKSGRRPVPSEEDFFRLDPDEPLAKKNEKHFQIQRNLQCVVSFGSHMGASRFGNPPTFNTAGVGCYNVDVKKTPTFINSSFGRNPILVQQSTKTKCVFDKDETCIECGIIFHMNDFYRTRFAVNVPLPETKPIEMLEKDFPRGRKYVNLCNACYYRASIGQSKNWPQKKLKSMFQKTRTCAVIHKHDKLPEVIHRGNCRMFKKLQRKELIFSKHFKDNVEESLIFLKEY